ncbi:hypothetical protein SCLCIDRAFT_1217045 [Scleroderma citrinum Foug A]|uniref:Uncharacterized protein n=1 Tax=Scleroderma citrinum Foug A TaxID=1036808 RepID=A0A0C2ZEW0_9AGAM|nr:hypothetical protein SCLCIDRAFT_1217045 [Scleroderma citrinum Foug A]
MGSSWDLLGHRLHVPVTDPSTGLSDHGNTTPATHAQVITNISASEKSEDNPGQK